MGSMDRFLYWIEERHNIHLKSQRGDPKPWTDDPVLQRYFFTNPYRENDKTTVWFRENVRDKLGSSDEVVFATVCFRWFNYIPTGKVLVRWKLLTRWNTAKAIKQLSRADGKVFTGAFNISNSGSTKPKLQRVCEDYVGPVWKRRRQLSSELKMCSRMREAHAVLQELCPCMGGSGFMAYEVVCDLRYTEAIGSKDRSRWSNPGPGAKRGLNRLLGRPLSDKPKDWEDRTVELLKEVRTRLSHMPRFEMREIEHSLCEFDKYERARLGDGHLKRRYDGCD